MRPRGSIRQTLWSVYAEGGALSWREAIPRIVAVEPSLACRSGVMLVRRTVENMTRTGDLVRVGGHKPPGSRTWVGIYECRPPGEAPACDALTDVLQSWARPPAE